MKAVRLLFSAAAATASGWIASRLGIPLAWLIGAMLASAAISLGTGALVVPRGLYRSGQIVVGVSVGLTVTGAVFDRIGPHLLLVPLLAMVSILLGRLMVPLLVWSSGLDRRTAFFSLVPAGISEMADLAQSKGADGGAVATLHATRVFLVVLILPAIITGLGAPALGESVRSAGTWDGPFTLALAAGLASGLIGNRLGLPSAFVVGSMVGVAALSSTGIVSARTPAALLAGAQVLLGLSLGTRFRRDAIRRLPRALSAGTLVLLLNGVLMAGAGIALAYLFELDRALMLLASATGGTAEMVLTAQVVATDVALVALYQVTRGLAGNLLALPLYALTVRPREASLGLAGTRPAQSARRESGGHDDQTPGE